MYIKQQTRIWLNSDQQMSHFLASFLVPGEDKIEEKYCNKKKKNTWKSFETLIFMISLKKKGERQSHKQRRVIL